MKHLIPRVLLLSLLLVLCLSAVSCKKSGIEVPDGMQLCSSEKLEYCFFVPLGWTVNDQSGTTSAYRAIDEENHPVASVTVTTYSPVEPLDLAGYWEISEESYESEFKNYTFVSSEATTVAELNAMTYVYSADFGGVTYKFNQTVMIERGRFYIITYTAKADSYDTYLADLASMKAEIYFR